jgi:acetylornithine deacetylase/succinyl-diaminopimelate desuccinylase-like protein
VLGVQRTELSFLVKIALPVVAAAGFALLSGCEPNGVGAEPEPAPTATVERSDDDIVGAVADRAADLLSSYIRLDTVNPPGNETAGAQFLSELLESEGISTQLFEPEPGRGSLFAKLPGTGAKRPLILLSHIDVVPADADEWSHPPFQGLIVDGAVHGRGALDAKGVGITQALALIAVKRLGVTLERDIILLATADEEAGGHLGARWFVENKFGLIADAEFVLTEGGFIRRSEGRPLIYNLNAGEKGPCWFRVTASGDPGHGSRPAAVTAVTRLITALEKLTAWQQPIEVGPVVAGYYAAYAALDEEHSRQFRQLARSLEDPTFRQWFMSDPAAAALVQNTVAPTVLVGSAKTNIIPGRASAEIDARLLPGYECSGFLDDVRALIGDEYVVIEDVGVDFASSQSPLDNALTEAVEKVAAADPASAVVLPGLQAGFTDSHYFREQGIHAYGFVPIVVSSEERNAMHGPNERVRIGDLSAGVVRLVDLLNEVAAPTQ